MLPDLGEDAAGALDGQPGTGLRGHARRARDRMGTSTPTGSHAGSASMMSTSGSSPSPGSEAIAGVVPVRRAPLFQRAVAQLHVPEQR